MKRGLIAALLCAGLVALTACTGTTALAPSGETPLRDCANIPPPKPQTCLAL
jgi:hypothetical protein